MTQAQNKANCLLLRGGRTLAATVDAYLTLPTTLKQSRQNCCSNSVPTLREYCHSFQLYQLPPLGKELGKVPAIDSK